MKSVIFGGSFDPPHFGHQACIEALVENKISEEIFIVPTGDDRYDKERHASSLHRLAMLKIFCTELKDKFPNVKITLDDVQLCGKLPEGSVAIDLVRYYLEIYPEKKFAYLIGSDNLTNLESWKDYEQLKTLTSFLVVSRKGFSSDVSDANIMVLNSDKISTNIASSGIRRAAKTVQLEGIKTSPSILKYIEENQLYMA